MYIKVFELPFDCILRIQIARILIVLSIENQTGKKYLPVKHYTQCECAFNTGY